MTEYQYSIVNDFPNHVVASDSLTLGIRTSAIVTALDRIDTLGDVCSVWFKGPLSGTDEALLDQLVAVHVGAVVADPPTPVAMFGTVGKAKQNTDGLLQFTSEPRVGSEVIYGTHNFSDPTTWFAESGRVVDEQLAETDGIVYQLANTLVLNMNRGRVFDDRQYKLDQQAENPGDPHAYQVVVKSDGVTKTPRAEFATSGGDYTLNCETGQLTFFASQTGKLVEVSYSYAQGSGFFVTPDLGAQLNIEKAKVIYSDDFVLNDSVQFVIYGYSQFFAPQLGLPEDTRIPLTTTQYDTFRQIIAEADEAEGPIPSAGGAARGTLHPHHLLKFRYGTKRPMVGTFGIQLCVRLENDTPCGGETTSATFYCVVAPEGA